MDAKRIIKKVAVLGSGSDGQQELPVISRTSAYKCCCLILYRRMHLQAIKKQATK